MNLAENTLLARLRRESAETFLVDDVVVTRPGAKTLVEGLEVVGNEEVYSGPARLVERVSGSDGVQRSVVEFPFASFKAQDGDLVTWVNAADPSLVDCVVKIRSEVPGASIPNLYRVNAERDL